MVRLMEVKKMRHLIIAVLILAAAAIAQEQSPDATGTGRMQVLGEEGVVGELPLEHTSVVIDVSGNLQRAKIGRAHV